MKVNPAIIRECIKAFEFMKLVNELGWDKLRGELSVSGSNPEQLCETWLKRGMDVSLLISECKSLLNLGASMFQT